MKTSRILALAFFGWLLVGVTPARAQHAGAFARMGFGARGVAMSNALVADAFGGASPYYNPALSPFIEQQNLSAAAGFLTFDRELQFLQFATPLEPSAGIAAGLIHAGVSSIDGRDASGRHTQDYSTDEFAFFLNFGTRVGERFTLGVGLQLFRADYLEDLQAVNSLGIDLGVTARVTEALRLGLAVDDLLASYSWDTGDIYGEAGQSTSDPFPRRIRLGAAYALMDGRTRLVAEYESRLASAEHRTTRTELSGDRPDEFSETDDLRLQSSWFRVGAEVQLAEPFTLRAGVDRLGDDLVSGATPSAGFMVQQTVGQLVARAEYAFMLEPYASGTMHFLALQVFL